ncbi:signal recognition particle, SRP9/SRP14 subunit [Rhodotorula sp. JG-1b]|nr:signal recognition particle, SRP9/SRP14 subunit [Rhodotorula sp. JG-1b]
MHLSNAEFLERLAALFAERKDAGTVFLTQKRLTYETDASTSSPGDVELTDASAGMAASSSSRARDSTPHEEQDREWPLLLRATDGRGKKDTKIKISTTVQPADIESFLSSYSTLLRSSFSGGLRPKKKKGDLARQRALKAAKRQAAKATAKGTAVDSATAAVLAGSGVAAGGGGGAAHFAPRLPKVVGPRRGNGVQKRRRLIKRREKAVERFKATRTRATAD